MKPGGFLRAAVGNEVPTRSAAPIRKGESTEMEERTFVDDIDRSIYDIRNEEKDAYRIETGLSPAIVEQISREKNDPLWM